MSTKTGADVQINAPSAQKTQSAKTTRGVVFFYFFTFPCRSVFVPAALLRPSTACNS